MRGDLSEEGWAFGSRRLALLATVLAVVAALVLAVALWSTAERRTRSVDLPPGDTGVTVGIPEAAPYRPSAKSTPTPTTPQVETGPDAGVVGERRVAPVARATSPERPLRASNADVRPTPSITPRAEPAAARPEPGPAAPVSAPVSVPSPEPAPVPERVQETPRQAPAERPSVTEPDRNATSRVERRVTRREAREATEAVRDIRPR